MSLDKVLADIFDRNANQIALDDVQERALVAAAKAGDSDAVVHLMYAYAPALRNAVSAFTHAGGVAAASQRVDHEDLRSSVMVGFMEAIQDFDPEIHRRLAAVVSGPLREAIAANLTSPVAFTVPTRTLTRYYAILRLADGNPFEAVKIARAHHMSPETFMAVRAAVRAAESIDGSPSGDEEVPLQNDVVATPLWDNSAAEEDRVLVKAAFDAVDEVEATVCRYAYGFKTYGDPVADVEIAHELGMTRPTVQRRRASALGKMRAALALDAD